ncbi:MAG: cysteine desulfurase family protein [Melioribacter sp.]|uniref:cysteine desulfurase family protein n=1 Tax=Rosettibacter primus TaxID=3111523 RepID=UPI00247DE337|nr:cysteine desulfurase family protein [Melioribacter sp.]
MKVYFDNAATTPLNPQVFEKMKPYVTEFFGNPSSIHSYGRKTRVAIEEAREVIAEFINAKPGEIYFTSGGTEANNFIITGITKTEFSESRKNKIITTKGEHHSVLDTCYELTKYGFELQLIDIDKNSKIILSDFENKINENCALTSVIHINNETGSINPIEELSSITKRKKIYFHTDAVQSFGKIKIDVNELGIDALSASAHKINGPKGTGFAYVRSGTPISPLIFGGSQERNRRGGTENVAGIVGLAEAVKIAKAEMVKNYEHVKKLRDEFVKGIKILDKDFIKINGGEDAFPYILSITFLSEKYRNEAEAMLMFLDINGIAASNGAACTSGTLKPSHVIINSGYKLEDAAGTIRFSFGSQNTFKEVEYALEILKKMIEKFRK